MNESVIVAALGGKTETLHQKMAAEERQTSSATKPSSWHVLKSKRRMA